MSVLSALNISAQTATPSWVRARVMAIYLLVFTGGPGRGERSLWFHSTEGRHLQCPLVISGRPDCWSTVDVALSSGWQAGFVAAPSLHWPPIRLTRSRRTMQVVVANALHGRRRFVKDCLNQSLVFPTTTKYVNHPRPETIVNSSTDRFVLSSGVNDDQCGCS